MNGDSFAHSTNLLVTILYETWELDMNKGWPLFSESPSLVETVALLCGQRGEGWVLPGPGKTEGLSSKHRFEHLYLSLFE